MHTIELVESSSALSGGDLLFLVSCGELIYASIRSRYQATLVLHASKLPKGRGWSPLIWQILEGNTDITVSLLEAEDIVDTGRIWKEEVLKIADHELINEINNKLFGAELRLMDYAVDNFDSVRPYVQNDEPPTYYRKRTPEDSRLDPNKSIAEQFDLLRVADENRYPAFIDLRGHKYKIVITKIEKSQKT